MARLAAVATPRGRWLSDLEPQGQRHRGPRRGKCSVVVNVKIDRQRCQTIRHPTNNYYYTLSTHCQRRASRRHRQRQQQCRATAPARASTFRNHGPSTRPRSNTNRCQTMTFSAASAGSPTARTPLCRRAMPHTRPTRQGLYRGTGRVWARALVLVRGSTLNPSSRRGLTGQNGQTASSDQNGHNG